MATPIATTSDEQIRKTTQSPERRLTTEENGMGSGDNDTSPTKVPFHPTVGIYIYILLFLYTVC